MIKIARSKSSRKYQITINNPKEKGYTHERIKDILTNDFTNLIYACFCDEIGLENGTHHTHIFIICKNGIMFSTIQKRFYGAHIEIARGLNIDNYNYIRKIGEKYENKKESNLTETFEEIGELPKDRSCSENLNEQIYEMIENDCSVAEIINEYPNAIRQINNIEKTISMYKANKVKNIFRKLEVSYIYGATGVGKTRTVMEHFGYENVYRVTNYKNPFDNYNGQDVILFDEFRSSLPISDMLVYLDGYPVNLPCRYSDKPALYTKVYIISNISLEKQYVEVQKYEPETYKAFLRRFTNEQIELIG